MRHGLYLVCALAAAPAAAAQVGNPPAHSPYRDIPKKMNATALVGYIGGDGGALGIGPHDGPAYGGRFGIAVSRPLEFSLSVQYAPLEGNLVYRDTSGKLTVSNPVPSPVWMFEGGVQFTVTGAKTWHGLAPYIGGGLGFAWRTDSPGSPDAFDFGGRFYLAPFAGTRFYLQPRTFLRAEIRGAFWKLAYPDYYYDEVNGIIESFAENTYLSNVWYQVGIGYSF